MGVYSVARRRGGTAGVARPAGLRAGELRVGEESGASPLVREKAEGFERDCCAGEDKSIGANSSFRVIIQLT